MFGGEFQILWRGIFLWKTLYLGSRQWLCVCVHICTGWRDSFSFQGVIWSNYFTYSYTYNELASSPSPKPVLFLVVWQATKSWAGLGTRLTMSYRLSLDPQGLHSYEKKLGCDLFMNTSHCILGSAFSRPYQPWSSGTGHQQCNSGPGSQWDGTTPATSSISQIPPLGNIHCCFYPTGDYSSNSLTLHIWLKVNRLSYPTKW